VLLDSEVGKRGKGDKETRRQGDWEMGRWGEGEKVEK
jgi:hypothetical protein